MRLIGIDTPERDECFFSQASARTRALALGQRVVLRGDASQDTRDRYGRLPAYVDVRGATDLGRALVRSGHAEVYVYERAFSRVAAYRAAESAAKAAAAGLWSGCAASPPPAPSPPSARCDRSYPTVCIPPPPPDLDCSDIPHRDFPVVGADPHHFDGNRDGRGCEG